MPCSFCSQVGHNIKTCRSYRPNIIKQILTQMVNTIETKNKLKSPTLVIDNKKNAGKKESEDLKGIVKNINDKTESGCKIMEALENAFGLIIKKVEIIGGREKHYDLLIHTCNVNDPYKLVEYKVEYKGSLNKANIKGSLPPWYNGVQFYNGNPKSFTLISKYLVLWYDTYYNNNYMDQFKISHDIPTFEDWSKDAYRQGKNKNEYMIDFVNKYREMRKKKSMIVERTEFNSGFKISEEDLEVLKNEIGPIYKNIMKDKEYWLQITGDIEHPDNFNVKWTPGMALTYIPELKKITVKTQSPDIKFNCECEQIGDSTPFTFEAHLRWGGGQGFCNIRLDFK